MIAGLIGCSVAARMYTDYYPCSFLRVRVNLKRFFLPSFLPLLVVNNRAYSFSSLFYNFVPSPSR